MRTVTFNHRVVWAWDAHSWGSVFFETVYLCLWKRDSALWGTVMFSRTPGKSRAHRHLSAHLYVPTPAEHGFMKSNRTTTPLTARIQNADLFDGMVELVGSEELWKKTKMDDMTVGNVSR